VITMTPSVSGCPFQISATRSGAQLSGTYMSVNCGIRGSGTVSVTRQ
jgi:hypothetical protein